MPAACAPTGAQPLTRRRRIGKARRVGPGARRPASGRSPTHPRGKGLAHMRHHRRSNRVLRVPLLVGALALLTAAAPAPAGAAQTVTVRIEGEAATLLPATAVTLEAP